MSTTLVSFGVGASAGWNYQLVASPSNIPAASSFQFSPSSFANGTGAGQVDRLYVANTTLAASGNITYTFTSFTDFFGNTVSMVRFKLLWFSLPSPGAPAGPASGGVQASDFAVGAATHPLTNWSSSRNVRSGGLTFDCSPVDATGWAISAGATDQLKLVNNDAVNIGTYTLLVMGCSA